MAVEYTNFGRTVEVSVLIKSTGNETTFTCFPLRLSELPRPNISAKVDYKTGGKTTKCVVKIINPPQRLVGELLGSGTQTVVRVSAGYDGVLDEVFLGAPIKEGVKYSANGGKDAELVLECSAGAKLYREAIASISHTGSISARQLIQDVCDQANLRVFGLTEVPENVVYPSGYYATSNAFTLLEKIAFHTKTTITFIGEDEVLFTGRFTQPTGNFERVAFFDQEKAGVIGVPTLTDKGLKFRTLLRGGIRPGDFVSVRYWNMLEQTYVTSTVRVSDVTFSLTTYGKDFYSTITGKEVDRAV